jgi:ATP synthase F1 complex assembly factor 1
MTLFTELLESKGVALMRGDIIEFKMSKAEADFTAHNLINFYLSPEIYENFIHKFNHD